MWDQDGAVQEAAELHPDVVAPVGLAVHHHREPKLGMTSRTQVAVLAATEVRDHQARA